MEKVDILGIRVANLNTREFIETIFNPGYKDRPTRISYVNANIVNIAYTDKEFKDILGKTDMVYADGYSVVLASRILGRPLKERVNAADFFDEFCKQCIRKERSVYFLGGGTDILGDLYSILRNKYPSLKILGLKEGYFLAEEEKKIIKEINELRPNFLIVGLGSPKQELFIYRHSAQLEVDAIWAVGGLFNLLAGRIKRAPLFLRNAGLEWIYRLFQEPQRLWRRYLIGNAAFLWRLAQEILIRRCAKAEKMHLYDFLKRIIDIIFSLCIVLFLLPLFFLIRSQRPGLRLRDRERPKG